ncbi:MAG: hypothetical protein GY701_24215 [Sulfitobacter sp.]|nr:hypothetical protein [Sulfitobacter sp.]
MIELTLPQPLATLAVEGVVTVLVVPEPPECEYCDGDGSYFIYEGEGDHSILVCSDCDDGLARWPAEVTIRSSDAVWPPSRDGEEMSQYRVWSESIFHPGMGCIVGWDKESIPLPRGEVLGSVTVEAAVPITGGVDEHDAAQIVWESTRVITYASKGEHFVAEGWSLTDDGVTHKTGRWAPSDEFGLFDISDQLAFQDFPVGHTALILEGETDG